MASTNINYYQTQKDLQEIMHTSEQKRKQLEVQLQTYLQSDQKLAQLRTVKLQSYLRHIAEDSQRSRQRNSQLLRDLDSMESRMAEIAARRHRLGDLKEQYWAFIDRTYPQWVASTQNKLQEEQQQQQLKQQQQQLKQQQQQQQQVKQQQQQQQQLQQQQLQQQQQRRLQEEEAQQAIVAQQQHQSRLQDQQLQQQLFEREQSMQEQRRHQTLLAEENKIQRQKHQQQQKGLTMEHEAHPRPESPEQQYQQQQQQRLMGSREEDDDSPPPLPHSPPPPITSLHNNGYGDVMPDREYVNLQDLYLGEQDRTPVQPPLPFVTVHMPNMSHMEGSGGRSDPAKRGDQQGSLAERDGSVHSVSFSESMEVPISQPVRSVTVQQRQPEPQKQTLGPMAPTSEDEISDFMDDVDLPSNKDPAPHTGGNMLADQAPPTSQAPAVPTGKQASDSHRSPHSVEPEMSIPSLLHLIKFLNDDISDALAVEGYYRSRNPDAALRKEIINKSKNKATLGGQDGRLVSMVLLEQLTPVVRHLPGACLLPDTLLTQDMDRLTATHVRSSLHRDAQPLWDRLLEHFVCLLSNHVMGSREMAYVFVPCLTHDNSLHQDKAVCLLERVIEELLDETETVPDTSSVTSPRSSQPGPAETEAYKHLLSGTRPRWPAPTVEENETDDNTYNADLENQFASNLSPRSPASTLKSALGSGATAHQKKLGRMISSDLDTDTELEIAQDTKKDDHEDDDFYDFYG